MPLNKIKQSNNFSKIYTEESPFHPSVVRPPNQRFLTNNHWQLWSIWIENGKY